MSSDIDIIYLGRDNTNELLLKVDGVGQVLDSVTRIDLEFDDGFQVSNSTGSAWPIKWLGLDQNGKVELKLGQFTITPGNRTCRLVTVDPIDTNGIVWSGQNGIRFFVTAAT